MNKWIEKYRAWSRKEDETSAEAMSRLSPKGVTRTMDGIFGVGCLYGIIIGVGVMLIASIDLRLVTGGLLATSLVVSSSWELHRYWKIRDSISKAAKVVSP